MAESLEADALIGRVVGTKFRIDKLIGTGGMGRVYLAEQTNLNKQVALKVLHASKSGDPSLAKRFHREARSASMLAHPNILSIIDFGDDDGLLFIAMELLTGRDLYRVIKKDWPFSSQRIGHIGGQILSALDEAHEKGVVHRDLKPENVMLVDVRGEDDFVKVCDFGIAKIASERDGNESAITVAGMVCGTPEYMSPEQARGDALDGRSDLYAAAVILYQMVVGDVPFRAESALGVITKQLTEAPTPPSKRIDITVPPALEAVILRGLSKDRNLRFATARQMKDALFEALGMQRFSTPSAPRSASTPADVATAATGVATPVSVPPPASWPTAPTMPPGRRMFPVMGGLALLLSLGSTAYVVTSKRIEARTTTPTAPPAAPPTAPVAALPATTISPSSAPAVSEEEVAPTPTPVRHKKEARPHATKTAKAPVLAAAAGKAPPTAPAPTSPFADGEALFRAGDVDGALQKYLVAAKQDPSDAKTQRQIGKCYNRLGQRDRAEPYLKKYLELEPNASDAPFIRRILDGK